MVNENNNLQETDHVEVGRLIGTLKRVNAPNDFDFQVRARIARGTRVEKGSSWLPAAVRYAAPLVLLLAVGGYLGFRTVYSTAEIAVPTVAYSPEVSAPNPITQPYDQAAVPAAVVDQPGNQTLAGLAPSDAGNRVMRTAQRTPSTSNSKTVITGGGSYDTSQSNAADIRPEDVDDNAPPTSRKIIVSASQFLNSAGILSSGGKILSVSGAAADAGLRAGDVIEAINVQSGTIRVSRDGKKIVVTIR